MSEIQKLKQGAEILQQVDVTDIISSLAVGIADAQEQLDNNSIKQALALADPNNGIGGKSLLGLGFTPAFYHFQYADVSAEIALKMRLQTEFEIDASLNFNYTQQGGYSSDKLDYLREDSSEVDRTEYKSSRTFITHSNNYEDLSIESEKVRMDETKGCVTRVEDFSDQIRRNEKIDRVLVDVKNEKYSASDIQTSGQSFFAQNAGGYFVLTVPQNPTDNEGILKVADYTLGSGDETEVEFDGNAGNELEIGAAELKTFGEVFGASETIMTAGNFIGFEANDSLYYVKDGNAGLGTGMAMEVYFEHDRWDARLALGQNLNDNNVTKDNTVVQPVLKKLAQILKSDPTAEIEILGHTDGSGKNGYNVKLSNKRSGSLKNWFIDQGVNGSQIKTKGTGETIAGSDQTKNLTFRKVEIKFLSGADYFYYSGGPFDSTAATASGTINQFIYLKDGGLGSQWPLGVSFKVDGTTFLDETASAYADFSEITTNQSIRDAFTSEVIGDSLYLLHNESQVKYTTYSKDSEEQKYAIGSREEEDFNDSETRYLIDETINTKTRIKKDQETRKNPSTIAVGASVDVRVARQFEMDVSGNSKVSARLVSLPAPPEFLDEIKSYYNQ